MSTQPTTGTRVCPPGQHWSPRDQRCVGSTNDPAPWSDNHPTEPPSPPPTPTTPTPTQTPGRVPCPPGFHHAGGHPGNPCKPDKPQAPAAAPSTGLAPRPPAPPPVAAPAGPNAPENIETMLLEHIKKILSGESSAYSPNAVTAMRSQAIRDAEGAARAKKDQLTEDLINRGLFRSGIAARGMQDIDRAAMTEQSQRFGEIEIEKARVDAQQKLQYLTMLEGWLARKEDAVLRRETNAINREIGLAQIKLGYARIDAEKQMLEMQLAKMGKGGGGRDPADQDLEIILGLLGQ